jgi:hypothetical protein
MFAAGEARVLAERIEVDGSRIVRAATIGRYGRLQLIKTHSYSIDVEETLLVDLTTSTV